MAEARTAERQDAATAYLEAYGRMLLIRVFEQAMHTLFLEGEVHGTTHLSAGQEASGSASACALDTDDKVAGTYRGHGHALAWASTPRR